MEVYKSIALLYSWQICNIFVFERKRYNISFTGVMHRRIICSLAGRKREQPDLAGLKGAQIIGNRSCESINTRGEQDI